MSGLDGTITELDWNIFSENESDILAIGENALEWDVNGSNVERSGASFGFKYFILSSADHLIFKDSHRSWAKFWIRNEVIMMLAEILVRFKKIIFTQIKDW